MGLRKLGTKYIKDCNIDPHSFKDEYDCGSEYDMYVDTDDGQIVLISKIYGTEIYTGEYMDEYKEGKNNE